MINEQLNKELNIHKKVNIYNNNIIIFNNKKIKINENKKKYFFLIIMFIHSAFYIENILSLYKKDLPKFRQLNFQYSQIMITLNTTGNKKFINNLNPLPDEIIINGINVTENTINSLSYNFEYGESNIIVRWHYNKYLTSCSEMFSELEYITKIDLSNFDSSKVTSTRKMFFKCYNLIELNLSNLDTSLVDDMFKMFSECTLMTSFDLSSFITSKVENMEGLFLSDYELISIDLKNFDTSKVTTMKYMFMNCNKLKSIKLSNFITTSLNVVNSMFNGCKCLTSIDLSSFDTSNVVDFNSIFYNCENLEIILQNFNTSNCENMDNMFLGCRKLSSLEISNFNISKITTMKSMFENCENLKYLNLLNFDSSSVINMENMFYGCISLKYLNMYSFTENADLNVANMFNNTNENLIYCIKDISKATKIVSLLDEKKSMNNCSSKCFSEVNICLEDKNNKKCDKYYSYDKKECIDEIPEGYYLNSSSLKTIDKCPIKCKLCSDNSMKKNLCISCNSNYSEVKKNEFYECKMKCPEGYININNICEISYNIISCDTNEYELISNHSCIDICRSANFLNNICKAKNNTINKIIDRINSIREDITNGNLDLLLENVTNNQKSDVEIFEGDIVYQITSTFNQNNNQYDNISIIKLKECEEKLKYYYKIDEDESLIIFKVDIYVEGLLIPIIEYEVYHPFTLEKINLDICQNITIEVSLPVSIDENELYKYNTSSDYYNDKCYLYTSEKGTDLTLSDRQLDYVNYNLTLCEDNCELEGYNNITKYVKCNCEIKNETDVSEDITLDKDKLLNSFIDIKNIINLDVLKCYYILFKKEGLLYNIGSYIILCIMSIFCILTIIFVVKDYKLLINQIKRIFKEKKKSNINMKSNNVNKIMKKTIFNRVKIKRNTHNNNNNKICLTDRKIISLKKTKNEKENTNYPPKKKSKKKKNINHSSNSIFHVRQNSHNLNISKSFSKISLTMNKENKSKDEIKIKSKFYKGNNKIIKKDINNNNIILDLNDYEINTLIYADALKYDQRTYSQYYFSLLRTKHILVLAFYPNKSDYNSQVMKICLFFFSFALYFSVNALFFTDETIHTIHENNGKYDFIYQIPQMLYSTIISSFISALIKYFSLSEKNILEIKNEKKLKNCNNKIPQVIKCLKKKFILFFILSFSFLFFFWSYLSCFCAVYKNTQIYLVKDTLFSFLFSLLYPLGVYLIPGFFRIPSLNSSKNNKEILYKLSKIIQMF